LYISQTGTELAWFENKTLYIIDIRRCMQGESLFLQKIDLRKKMYKFNYHQLKKQNGKKNTFRLVR